MVKSRFRVSVGPRAVEIIRWFNANPNKRLFSHENHENFTALGQLQRLGIITPNGGGFVLASAVSNRVPVADVPGTTSDDLVPDFAGL